MHGNARMAAHFRALFNALFKSLFKVLFHGEQKIFEEREANELRSEQKISMIKSRKRGTTIRRKKECETHQKCRFDIRKISQSELR